MSHYRPLLFGVLVAATCAVPPAFAGWGPDGVTIRSTAASIPIVDACSDGSAGTFVAWQEATAYPNGVLRLQHVLAAGDLDPAWPAAGVLVSAVESSRDNVDMLPDGQGGLYVSWLGAGIMYVIRLEGSGQVATGWPVSGKSLGPAASFFGTPRTIADGDHGVFVAWVSSGAVVVRHLGPDGSGVGGWPNANVTVAPAVTSPPVYRLWPELVRAPDGGLFVSWVTMSTDTTVLESGMYLRRLTAAGTNASGWPAAGVYLEAFRWESLSGFPRSPLLDISEDGRGGLFWIAGVIDGLQVNVRLHRMLGDGSPSPDWPADGREVPSFYWGYDYAPGPDNGLRVHPDGLDGAVAEVHATYTDSPSITAISRCSNDGHWEGMGQLVSVGHEMVIQRGTIAFMADFDPQGPMNYYDTPAFLSVDQSNPPAGWTRWHEGSSEPVTIWYGDIALAPAGDGVVFFWSQEHDRFGLFARRFTSAGQVTSVPPGPGADGPPGLHSLRFVEGTGIVAKVSMAQTPTRFDLFDLTGRLLSSRIFDVFAQGGPAGYDVTFPGTGGLSSGIYFARMTWGTSAAKSKVAVVR